MILYRQGLVGFDNSTRSARPDAAVFFGRIGRLPFGALSRPLTVRQHGHERRSVPGTFHSSA